MANEKLSQLANGMPAQSTDLVYIARSGSQYALTVGQLLASALAALNFSALTTGTNTTAAMTVGTGASLAASGSGEILATNITPSVNPPQRIVLGSPVGLSAGVQAVILTQSVTFPSAPAGNYRADIRYGLWATIGGNAIAAEVIDTTNTLAFALSGQDANGTGYVGLSGSEMSANTYAAGSTAIFELVAIANNGAGGLVGVTVNNGLLTLSPAAATFLSITPVWSN